MGLYLYISADAAPNASPEAKAGASIGPTASLREKQQGAEETIPVLTFQELNARSVDPALVRPTVEHYLKTPNTLSRHEFLCLGMASSRYCDIHLVTNVCELVSIFICTCVLGEIGTVCGYFHVLMISCSDSFAFEGGSGQVSVDSWRDFDV